jgi:hypothetical protein
VSFVNWSAVGNFSFFGRFKYTDRCKSLLGWMETALQINGLRGASFYIFYVLYHSTRGTCSTLTQLRSSYTIVSFSTSAQISQRKYLFVSPNLTPSYAISRFANEWKRSTGRTVGRDRTLERGCLSALAQRLQM